MPKEIERKFLVVNDTYRQLAEKRVHIRQGYLSRNPGATVRVRIKDENAFITVKGCSKGFSRNEFEYEIPVKDAEEMLAMCSGRIIDKWRYLVPFGGHLWEVDIFEGDLKGLEVAEIELVSEEETFPLPGFVGDEVTGDPRYYNANL